MIKKAAEYVRVPKRVLYTLVLLVVISLIAWVLKPKSTPVDLGVISEGVFLKTISDEAITVFENKYTISAPADGITPTLGLKPGDLVKKGQSLLVFVWDQDFTLRSPIDGYILRVFEKDRRHLARGTPILELGSPESLKIEAKILTEEVIGVRVGQRAVITNWGKSDPLEAVVAKIEPSAKEEVSALGVKEQRVKVHFDIVSPKGLWQGLGDGYRVDISIITKEIPKAKLIPVGALFSSEGETAVYVRRGQKIDLVIVQIGDRNRDYAVLTSDLPVDTQVVLYPGSGLRPGQRVRERKK